MKMKMTMMTKMIFDNSTFRFVLAQCRVFAPWINMLLNLQCRNDDDEHEHDDDEHEHNDDEDDDGDNYMTI